MRVKQQQYARYEKGINALPINHLINICKVLDVSADYVIWLIDEPILYKNKM